MKLFDFDKTVSYRPKKGAGRIFQLLFYNFFDLVFANLLFVLTALPVFTVGAACCALGGITTEMVNDKPVSVCQAYFQFYKTYFKRGCLAGLIVFIPFLIICFSAHFYSELGKSIYAFKFAQLICVSAIFIIALVIPYFFHLIILEKATLLKTIKRAFWLSIYNMKATFLSFSVVFVMTAMIFLFSPYTIIVLVFLYFSLCSLLGAYCTIGALKKSF